MRYPFGQIYGTTGEAFGHAKVVRGDLQIFGAMSIGILVGFCDVQDAAKRRRLYGQPFSLGSILRMEDIFQKSLDMVRPTPGG